MKGIKITTPAEHRALLLAAMEALVEGRLNVAQANSLAGLSAEVHKNLRQEWDMRVYAAENLNLIDAEVVKLIGVDNADDDDAD